LSLLLTTNPRTGEAEPSGVLITHNKERLQSENGRMIHDFEGFVQLCEEVVVLDKR
jgi:hypothetical protein